LFYYIVDKPKKVFVLVFVFDFVYNPKFSQFWLCFPTGVTLACHHWSLWAHSYEV